MSFARSGIAQSKLSSTQPKIYKEAKISRNPSNIVIWNHEHLLVKLIESYGILEPEGSIQIQQKDFLISFLLGMMETYCSPKNKNPQESLAEFYFRYMKERYQLKVQVQKMCNSFAYSMQVYAKNDQEIKIFHDFFAVKAALQHQIATFLKVRQIMASYLANTASLDNINLETEQWSAILNRVFRGQQDSKHGLLEKIKTLQSSLPQKNIRFYLKATQLLELCVEEILTFRYSKPKAEGYRDSYPTETTGKFFDRQQERSGPGSTQLSKFRNENYLKEQASMKSLETESKIPIRSGRESYRYPTQGDEGASPRTYGEDIPEYYPETVQTVHNEYQEYEERDPNHQLTVSEAYQIEDLKRDRAYMKHQIGKVTAEKNEARLNTVQVLEFYDELMTKHKSLLQFAEDMQQQLSYLLCLVKNKEKDVFKAVDPEVANDFLTYKLEWPPILELNDAELLKMVAASQAARSKPSQKKGAHLGTKGQIELLELTKPKPKILIDLKEGPATQAPKTGGTANSLEKKATLVNETLSKVYNKALKNEKVMYNRLHEQVQNARKVEAQREAEYQQEYSSHGLYAMETHIPLVDFEEIKAKKEAKEANRLATRESTRDGFDTEGNTKRTQTVEAEMIEEKKEQDQAVIEIEKSQDKQTSQEEMKKDSQAEEIKIDDTTGTAKIEKEENTVLVGEEKTPQKPNLDGTAATQENQSNTISSEETKEPIESKGEEPLKEEPPKTVDQKVEPITDEKQEIKQEEREEKKEGVTQPEGPSQKKDEASEVQAEKKEDVQAEKKEDIQAVKSEQENEKLPSSNEELAKKQTDDVSTSKEEGTENKKEEETGVSQPKQKEEKPREVTEKPTESGESQQEGKQTQEEIKPEETKETAETTTKEEAQPVKIENQGETEKQQAEDKEKKEEPQPSPELLTQTQLQTTDQSQKSEEQVTKVESSEDQGKEAPAKQEENSDIQFPEKTENKQNDPQPVQLIESNGEQSNQKIISNSENASENKQEIFEVQKEEPQKQEEVKPEETPAKTEEQQPVKTDDTSAKTEEQQTKTEEQSEDPANKTTAKFKSPIFKPPTKK